MEESNPTETRASSEYLEPHLYTKPDDEESCYMYASTTHSPTDVTRIESAQNKVSQSDDSGYDNMPDTLKEMKEKQAESGITFIKSFNKKSSMCNT